MGLGAWFHEAKIGIFMVFGPYSVPDGEDMGKSLYVFNNLEFQLVLGQTWFSSRFSSVFGGSRFGRFEVQF